MKSGSSLNRDFKEFLGLLLEEAVDFALVGGFAVAYHGYPPVRIDLLTSLDGVGNEEVFSNLVRDDFYGLRIPIISLDLLKRNKRATGRTQDLLDLQNLP